MARSIASSIASKSGVLEENSNKEVKTKATKIEQKAYYDDCKCALSKTWKSMSDDSSAKKLKWMYHPTSKVTPFRTVVLRSLKE